MLWYAVSVKRMCTLQTLSIIRIDAHQPFYEVHTIILFLVLIHQMEGRYKVHITNILTEYFLEKMRSIFIYIDFTTIDGENTYLLTTES